MRLIEIRKHIHSLGRLEDIIESTPNDMAVLAIDNSKYEDNHARYINADQIISFRDVMFSINYILSSETIDSFKPSKLRIDTVNKYREEFPIYEFIAAGLIAKAVEIKYFFSDGNTSRKLVFANPNECISMVKIIYDGSILKLIAILRSSSDQMLSSDIAGLVYISQKLISTPDFCPSTEVELQMNIFDYHSIKDKILIYGGSK